MSQNVIEKIVEIVAESPHSAQSLLLFALYKTLDIPKGGHMYKLEKLREMTAENRQLAYGLMELMAEQKNSDEYWKAKLEEIEAAIRSNQ